MVKDLLDIIDSLAILIDESANRPNTIKVSSQLLLKARKMT